MEDKLFNFIEEVASTPPPDRAEAVGVFADWLEDHGDVRTAFLRRQLALESRLSSLPAVKTTDNGKHRLHHAFTRLESVRVMHGDAVCRAFLSAAVRTMPAHRTTRQSRDVARFSVAGARVYDATADVDVPSFVAFHGLIDFSLAGLPVQNWEPFKIYGVVVHTVEAAQDAADRDVQRAIREGRADEEAAGRRRAAAVAEAVVRTVADIWSSGSPAVPAESLVKAAAKMGGYHNAASLVGIAASRWLVVAADACEDVFRDWYRAGR